MNEIYNYNAAVIKGKNMILVSEKLFVGLL
jgi:hypothetical protein